MRIEHDQENDVAYISLVDVVPEGAATTQVAVEPPLANADITLDFDAEGRLLGIEVIGAAAVLGSAVLGPAG